MCYLLNFCFVCGCFIVLLRMTGCTAVPVLPI